MKWGFEHTNDIQYGKQLLYLIGSIFGVRVVLGVIAVILVATGNIGLSSMTSALTASRFSTPVGLVGCLSQGGCFGSKISFDEFFADRLPKTVFDYTSLDSALVGTLNTHSDDRQSMLGFYSPQTYLILLQNDAERRPNGGFYGSYAIVTIDHGVPTAVVIEDSYIPGFDTPESGIKGPDRMLSYLPSTEINFVGANKIGFTYRDGQHIKEVYEQSYPDRTIRGVVFLNTAMFRALLSDFTETQIRRQFINASVNLIRGNDTRGKKGLYLNSAEEYLKANALTLARAVLTNRDSVTYKHWINIYLTDVDRQVHKALRDDGLATRMPEDAGYFRDSNTSFNKTDLFVDRTGSCADEEGNTLSTLEQSGRMALDAASNLDGIDSFVCTLTYTYQTPPGYREQIAALADEFDITLTGREEHILGLNQEWQTRALFYLPQRFQITSIEGDIFNENIFDTPFASAGTYGIYLLGDGDSTTVTITVATGTGN